MSTENSRQPTGYPPVTEAEDRAAQAAPSTCHEMTAGCGRLSATDKVVVDALTEIFDKHRQRIHEVALEPAVKRFALDLLEALFLDSVQAALSASSTADMASEYR